MTLPEQTRQSIANHLAAHRADCRAGKCLPRPESEAATGGCEAKEMSTDLFDLPATPHVSLDTARARYATAVAAYEQSDTDETGDLGREVFRARAALDEMERQAINRAMPQ